MTVLSHNWVPSGWPEGSPARSILSGVYPYGMSSGGTREALGSFMNRACNAQGIGRWTMTSRVLAPMMGELIEFDPARMASDVARADYIPRLSGMTDVTSQWSEAMNRATSRNDLHMCTLLTLRGLVPPLKLQAKTRRYCPDCLDGDAQNSREPYTRLLWLLEPVKACHLHGVKLLDAPWGSEPEGGAESGVPSGRNVRELLAGTLAGSAASGFDIEISRIIADLLEDAAVLAGLALDKSGQSMFLKYAADMLFDGRQAHLARHLGVNKSQMHGWINGLANMSLRRLALVAYCCSCAIADVLLGNKVRLTIRSLPSHESTRLLNRRSGIDRKSDDEMRETLRRALQSGREIATYQIADELCTSPKYLRVNFPTEHRALVLAGRERRRSVIAESKRLFIEDYCRTHEAVARAGLKPTRRRVMANMPSRSRQRASWNDYGAAYREARARCAIAVQSKQRGTESRASTKGPDSAVSR
jgi:plasmid stability protein